MDKNKGSALIVSLAILMFISALSVAALTVISRQAHSTESNVWTAKALFAAEAGVQVKLAELRDQGITDDTLADLVGEVDGSDYNVSVVDWSSDGVDNDENGQVDDSAENNYYYLLSRGTHSRAERTIQATVQMGGGLAAPRAFAAIHLYNPTDDDGEVVPGASVNFRGVPNRIDGRDTALPDGIALSRLRARDLTPGSGEGKPILGIAVHDEQSVADITYALSRRPRRTDRVYGLDPDEYTAEQLEDYFCSDDPPDAELGPGSVADIVDFDPLDAEGVFAMAESYRALASSDNIYESGDIPRGRMTLGTEDSPQITVISHSSPPPISGNVSGAGVLVIEGNVTFTGNFTFAGVVVVVSNERTGVQMRGTPLIMGSIYAATTDPTVVQNATLLDMRGTPDVYYSSEALDLATAALSGGGGGSGEVTLLSAVEIGN